LPTKTLKRQQLLKRLLGYGVMGAKLVLGAILVSIILFAGCCSILAVNIPFTHENTVKNKYSGYVNLTQNDTKALDDTMKAIEGKFKQFNDTMTKAGLSADAASNYDIDGYQEAVNNFSSEYAKFSADEDSFYSFISTNDETLKNIGVETDETKTNITKAKAAYGKNETKLKFSVKLIKYMITFVEDTNKTMDLILYYNQYGQSLSSSQKSQFMVMYSNQYSLAVSDLDDFYNFIVANEDQIEEMGVGSAYDVEKGITQIKTAFYNFYQALQTGAYASTAT
jgi:outer membrane murein-binding lipoprotein Lpp